MKRACLLFLLASFAATPLPAQKTDAPKPPDVVGDWTGTWSVHNTDPSKVPPK